MPELYLHERLARLNRLRLAQLVVDTENENARLRYLLECVDERKTAEALERIDCRSCAHHTSQHGCINGVPCVRANQHRPLGPKQYWKNS